MQVTYHYQKYIKTQAMNNHLNLLNKKIKHSTE